MPILNVPESDHGSRLDVWLSANEPDWSRSRVQQWIRDGLVKVNGVVINKMRERLHDGDIVEVDPPPPPVEMDVQPEAIPLDVRYEDEHLLVINKPAGLVVHPAAGHESGTLVNALLHHCPDLPGIGGEKRPGIVHRLDKDTSGLLVVAKTESAMINLSRQFKDRSVRKMYIALVKGKPVPEAGHIETLIGRHPTDRKKMSANVERGRTALTRYETTERFPEATLLTLRIETGRTHQIRVHMAHLGHPVLGDQLYGRARALSNGTEVPRHMLHAYSLAFKHPATKGDMEFQAPVPEDMRALIQRLRAT